MGVVNLFQAVFCFLTQAFMVLLSTPHRLISSARNIRPQPESCVADMDSLNHPAGENAGEILDSRGPGFQQR